MIVRSELHHRKLRTGERSKEIGRQQLNPLISNPLFLLTYLEKFGESMAKAVYSYSERIRRLLTCLISLFVLITILALGAAAKSDPAPLQFLGILLLLIVAPMLGPCAQVFAITDYSIWQMLIVGLTLGSIIVIGLATKAKVFEWLMYVASYLWVLLGLSYTYYGV